MAENNIIEIPLSKTKLTKLLFFCILFLAGGAWMIIANPQVSNPVFNNAFAKALASYGSLIMGVVGIYLLSKKLFDKKPGLIISEQGIYDNSSVFRFGLIPWSDMLQIYERTVQKQHFVTIGLVDPEKYISKETNFIKKKLLQVNSKSYGSPIHISTNGLKTNHKDLLNLINSCFEKYRQQ